MVFPAIFFSLPASEAQVKSASPKEVTIIDQEEVPDLKPEVKVKPGWPKEVTIGIAPVGGTILYMGRRLRKIAGGESWDPWIYGGNWRTSPKHQK